MAILRRVMPTTVSAARSGSATRTLEVVRGRRAIGVVGGVVGRRVEDPAKHPREGS